MTTKEFLSKSVPPIISSLIIVITLGLLYTIGACYLNLNLREFISENPTWTFLVFVFFFCAFMFSLFYGEYSDKIFLRRDNAETIEKKDYMDHYWALDIHQFWIAFLGSFVGWIVSFLLISKTILYGIGNFTLGDYILIPIAFFGMTGQLPLYLRKGLLKYFSNLKIKKP